MNRGSLPVASRLVSLLRSNSLLSTEAELGRCIQTSGIFVPRTESDAVEPLHNSRTYTTLFNLNNLRGFASVPQPVNDDDAPPSRQGRGNANNRKPNTKPGGFTPRSGQQPNNNKFPPRQATGDNNNRQQSKQFLEKWGLSEQTQGGGGNNAKRSSNNNNNNKPRNPTHRGGNNNNNATTNNFQRRSHPAQPRDTGDKPSTSNNRSSNNNNRQWTPRPGGGGFDHSVNDQPPSNNNFNRTNNNKQSRGSVSSSNSTWTQKPVTRRKPPVNDLRKNHWLFREKDKAAAAEAAAENKQQQQQPKKAVPIKKAKKDEIKKVLIPENVTVVKLASLLGTSTEALEKVLSDLGETPRSDQEVVPPDAAELAALEFNFLVSFPTITTAATAEPRPPVVTVMGHVDHGKTSLLDALRSTSVAAREAGGITQHIGAFEVALPGTQQTATFIDTPGHAAFTAMRARGAAITDVVVLVVAADDGVMPQTREAIAHARAANCPIVVALTKCDLPGANPEKVKQQLLQEGLELEEVGGSVQTVEVAAPLGQGLRELEEAVMLQAELLELKADRKVPAAGVVIEARMDKGQGPTVTVVVTKGQLNVGQAVVIGTEWGKVRALRGPGGGAMRTALPGQPAEIVGLRGLPVAGDDLLAVVDEERAQRVSKARTERFEWRRHSAMARFVPGESDQEGDSEGPKVLPIVVKADVWGSVEAVRDALNALSTDKVTIKIIHSGVGPVSLSDVQLAVPSGAKVFGFNVRSAAEAEAEAKRHNVDVTCRRIIYELLEDAANAVEGAVPKEREEVIVGTASVLQMFPLTGKRGNKEVQSAMIAGCRVSEGSIKSDLLFRVLRGEEIVWEGRAASIRRHKLEVDAVGKGTECGIRLQGFDEVQLGDVLQCVDI